MDVVHITRQGGIQRLPKYNITLQHCMHGLVVRWWSRPYADSKVLQLACISIKNSNSYDS